MSKHDKSRREFLRRAAVGAGAIAGTNLVPDALAQGKQAAQPVPAEPTVPASESRSRVPQHGAFLNAHQAATVAAITERIMPGAPGKPGALDAAVLNYIDLALSGAYADLQDFYRNGLAQLDAYCRNSYQQPFVRLDAARQDQVIAALEQNKAAGFTWPTAQAFFNTLRTHTMEGMFADPIYGGNKDFAGWRLVGFPGAQAVYTPKDMESKERFTRAVMKGLQAQDKRR